MNAEKIKAVMKLVHETEKTSTNPKGLPRVEALRKVLKNTQLTDEEIDVLTHALNVKKEEV